MNGKRKKEKMTTSASKPMMSRRRKWAFRIICLLVMPILFFGVLEAGLRLIGYGYPGKAMVERQIDGKNLYCLNTQFTWRFFPPRMAREFDSSLVFEKEKSHQTYRIFVLGGSAAKGFPEPVHNFGRLLEAMLSDMYPDVDFEVHNTAIVAINSHVVREIAQDVAQCDPDLFIVYLGNNEVVGPFGPGTILTASPPSLPLIRANIMLRGTRTGQLFDAQLRRISSSREPPAKWEGMAMFLGEQVRSDAPALDAVYTNYEQNLRDICRIAIRASVPVIFSNVASNLKDCPPFASQHKQDLTPGQLKAWMQLYEQGMIHENNGQHAEAIAAYTAAAAIDVSYADLQFRLATCFREQGDFENARICYQKALQYDTLRFRADERINQIIRSVADGREHEGIYFADSVAAFNSSSPHGIPGRELFYEHVHMTYEGNYILARTIFPIVQKNLPAHVVKKTDAVLSADEVAKKVAFTGFERWVYLEHVFNAIMCKPPFTNQLYHDAIIRNEKSRLERLKQQCDKDQCLQEYASAIESNPDDWRLLRSEYQFLSAEGMVTGLQEEEAVLRKVIALCPDHEALRGLGMNLFQQKRFDDAREVLKQLLVIRPNSSDAYTLLGQIAQQRGQGKAAVRYFKTAIKQDPSASILPYGLLAQSYLAKGETARVSRVLHDAILNLPESEAAWAHFQLGGLLFKEGNRDEALTHMDTALRIKPEYAGQQVFQMQYSIIKGK